MSNNFDSSGYFAYKKNKIQNQAEKPRRTSKISFLFQLFVATFVVIFIVIVVGIMKYSSKMDIEYTKGDLQITSENFSVIPGYVNQEEEQQRKIDKRLIAIQQEENAPSEAKILKKDNNSEVISQIHVEGNKRLEKMEKIKKANEESEKRASMLTAFIEDVKPDKKEEEVGNIEVDDNIIVVSKLLVGRYVTFDDAKKVQNQIKANNPTSQPFVRKVGNVFSVQIGSYQDFAVAKTHAQTLRAKGFDVWIYQQ